MRQRPAVFIDRDGVLVEDVGYATSVEALKWIPGAASALGRLQAIGFDRVVVTNQSAVARGLLTEAALAGLHLELEARLATLGVSVDGWLFCPHHPSEGAAPYRCVCQCRKPAPGMLLDASRRFGLDLSRSYLIGDKRSDIAAGRSAGCRAVLVRTGHGASELARGPASALEEPHAVVDSIVEATEWITEDSSSAVSGAGTTEECLA